MSRATSGFLELASTCAAPARGAGCKWILGIRRPANLRRGSACRGICVLTCALRKATVPTHGCPFRSEWHRLCPGFRLGPAQPAQARRQFEQAAEAFFDPFLRLVDADRNQEPRDAVIGYDAQGRLLFVVHLIIEGDCIRIDSARKATSTERQTYDS